MRNQNTILYYTLPCQSVSENEPLTPSPKVQNEPLTPSPKVHFIFFLLNGADIDDNIKSRGLRSGYDERIIKMADIEDNNSSGKTLSDHIRNIFGIIGKYFKFSLIDSVIIGVANYAFMWFMHMPHGILISIIIGITNLIPNVGPVAGAIVGGTILMFYEVKQALWFLLFTVVLQILDSLLIKPHLFGKSFGVSGIVMLLAMLIGGGVFGILGMILVVPVVAVIQYIYKNILRPIIKGRNRSDGE